MELKYFLDLVKEIYNQITIIFKKRGKILFVMKESLVKKIVKEAEEISLSRLLHYSINLHSIGKDHSKFQEYFEDLKLKVDNQWPETVDWSEGLCELNEGHMQEGKEIIPKAVKEAYVRCLVCLDQQPPHLY